MQYRFQIFHLSYIRNHSSELLDVWNFVPLDLSRCVGAWAADPIFWLVTAMGPRIFDTDFLNNHILNKAMRI